MLNSSKNFRRFVIGFVAIVIVGLLGATIRKDLLESASRRDAIRKLRESGAEVEYNSDGAHRGIRNYVPFSILLAHDALAPVWKVSIGRKCTKIDLSLLTDLPEIEFLDLFGVSDCDMQDLPSLPRVRSLLIDCSGLTERGLAKLGALESIETIVFLHPPCSDRGFAGIPRFKRLKSVGFWETTLSSIRHVSRQDNFIDLGITDPICDLATLEIPEELKVLSFRLSSAKLNGSLLNGLSMPSLSDFRLTSHQDWYIHDNMSYPSLGGASHFSGLKTVRLLGFSISADWLNDFTSRTTVERLTLSYCELDTDFLIAVSTWPALRHLELNSVRITSPIIATRPPRLETITITNSTVASLEFLDAPSYETLKQRIIVGNTVQEYPVSNLDSED